MVIIPLASRGRLDRILLNTENKCSVYLIHVLGDEKQPAVSVTNVWDMLTSHYNNAVLASYHQKR